LLEPKPANFIPVDCRDVRLRSPREVDLHDCAVFQASAITCSIDLPVNPLA
jgi:hypothetical protein